MVESHTDGRPDDAVHEAAGMTDKSPFVTDGTVTTPKGFVAGSAYAGIKTYAKDKWDLGILVSEQPCVTVGVYTQNKFVSPSVTLTRQNVGYRRTGSRRAFARGLEPGQPGISGYSQYRGR